MKYPSLLLLAIAASAIPAVLSAQGFYRNLPIGHAEAECKPSSDGGVFAHFGLHPQRPLVKLNSAGEVLWAKAMPELAGYVPDQNGGVILIRHWDGIPQTGEQEYNSLLLQRLNADGEMVMNRRILIDDWDGEGYDNLRTAAWTPDGQLYLYTEASWTVQRMMKFDVNGELIWSKRGFYMDYESSNIWVLPDGGLVLFDMYFMPGTLGVARRLDANGTVIWVRRLNTSAPALFNTGMSLLVDDEGNMLMAFTAFSFSQPGPTPWVVLGKMDADANMIWSYAYRRDPGESMTSLHGSFYIAPSRILPNGNLYFGTVKGFEFTPQGIFVREQICTSPTFAPGFDEITHHFTTLPTADGWLQHGARRWTDPVFGNFVQMPLLGRTGMELDSTCFWMCNERTDITAVPPPPEIFSPSSWPMNLSSETFSSEVWPVETFEDVTMDLFEDACELPEIVEFNTYVQELHAVGRLLIYPDPVVAGQSVLVDAQGPMVLEVIDARGRVVSTQQHGTRPAMLNTAGWDAGLYLLRATRLNGQLLGTGRLVVQ